jgi:hypothetical protein
LPAAKSPKVRDIIWIKKCGKNPESKTSTDESAMWPTRFAHTDTQDTAITTQHQLKSQDVTSLEERRVPIPPTTALFYRYCYTLLMVISQLKTCMFDKRKQ